MKNFKKELIVVSVLNEHIENCIKIKNDLFEQFKEKQGTEKLVISESIKLMCDLINKTEIQRNNYVVENRLLQKVIESLN